MPQPRPRIGVTRWEEVPGEDVSLTGLDDYESNLISTNRGWLATAWNWSTAVSADGIAWQSLPDSLTGFWCGAPMVSNRVLLVHGCAYEVDGRTRVGHWTGHFLDD